MAKKSKKKGKGKKVSAKCAAKLGGKGSCAKKLKAFKRCTGLK